MNKREFVLAGCGTLGAGVAGAMQPSGNAPGPCAAGSAARPGIDARAGHAAWQAHSGERFVTLSPGGQRQELQLHRVEGLFSSQGAECFAAVFAVADGGMPLQAQTHPLLHPDSGQQVAVFLQPAGSAADGSALYRADFNRRV